MDLPRNCFRFFDWGNLSIFVTGFLLIIGNYYRNLVFRITNRFKLLILLRISSDITKRWIYWSLLFINSSNLCLSSLSFLFSTSYVLFWKSNVLSYVIYTLKICSSPEALGVVFDNCIPFFRWLFGKLLSSRWGSFSSMYKGFPESQLLLHDQCVYPKGYLRFYPID